MPNRTYSAASSYRYGFNSQEKDNDIKGEGNSYGAEYWEYDTRSGRRWNVDPKGNLSVSPFGCFNGNPILFADPKGDTLFVPHQVEGARTNSVSDINSLLKPENRKFISINQSGNVTLTGTPKELRAASLTDAGLDLLINLIETPEYYFYTASNTVTVYTTDLNVPGSTPVQTRIGLDESKYPSGSVISYAATKRTVYDPAGVAVTEVSDIQSTISNISKNKRGDENLWGNIQQTPARGFTASNGASKTFDGLVRISPGEYYNKNNGTKVVVPRAAIVFHELYENYFRTHFPNVGYNEAHAAAIQMEKVFASFSNLGDAPSNFEVK